MSKGAGPAPDFMGLADRMGQWNVGANQQQTLANRPNQYTPWGSTTWSQAPGGWNGLGPSAPPSNSGGNSLPPGGGLGGGIGGVGGGPFGGGGIGGGGGGIGGGVGGSGGGPFGGGGLGGTGGVGGGLGGGGLGGGGITPLTGPAPGGLSGGNGILLPNGPSGWGGGVGPGGASGPGGWDSWAPMLAQHGGPGDWSDGPGPGGASGPGGHPSLDNGGGADLGGGGGGPGPGLVQVGGGNQGPGDPNFGNGYTPGDTDPSQGPPPGGWGASGPGDPSGIGGGHQGGGGANVVPGHDPGMPGQWSQTTTLNPELQAAADAQMKLQNQRSGFGLQQFGQLSDAMKNPFSLGGLPGGGQALDGNVLDSLDTGMAGRDRAENALYGRATSRLDPQWNQREEQEKTQLANQGLDPSSQAYQTEMGNFNRSRNDAYDQARLGAQAGGGQEQALQFGMGLQGNQQRLGAQAQGYGQAEQTRGRSLAEMLQQRELPVNEMNALMNGQNVQNPQFGPFMGAGAAQSPNFLGAGQMQGAYNQNQQELNNAIFGDIGQGAGTFAKFLPFLMSDERTKQNIRRLPVEVLHGVPLVLFEYKHAPGRTEIGVIAQDVENVRPRAVVKDRNGIRYVNYADLGRD